jgi:hypothetical protein
MGESGVMSVAGLARFTDSGISVTGFPRSRDFGDCGPLWSALPFPLAMN